ncbi:hypothetical protein, partial [Halorubrum sp. GN11GM_10-3_MGM]|uniref:hypothetical protein n=1 Tax=Halorubrum sp. GN11GM_10-3_MGM TaxID=2518111 RepID=UPI001A7E0F1E
RRLREESIEIILAEVTDDLFTAIPRHSYTSNSTFITSTRHYALSNHAPHSVAHSVRSLLAVLTSPAPAFRLPL